MINLRFINTYSKVKFFNHLYLNLFCIQNQSFFSISISLYCPLVKIWARKCGGWKRWQDNSGGLFAPQFKNIRGQTNSEKFGGIQKWKKFVGPRIMSNYRFFLEIRGDLKFVIHLPPNFTNKCLFYKNWGGFGICCFWPRILQKKALFWIIRGQMSLDA